MTSPTEPARPNARIEAAAKAVFDADDELDTGATWEQTSDEAREWCRDIAIAALNAYGAVQSSDAEKLREALRAFYEADMTFRESGPAISEPDYQIVLAQARTDDELCMALGIDVRKWPSCKTARSALYGQGLVVWTGEERNGQRVWQVYSDTVDVAGERL